MAKPARAVITCMDYRIKDAVILDHLNWNQEGAYFLRNAGGAVTQDVIRSLTVLQQFVLQTLTGATYDIDIAVIAHTNCGMQTPAGREDQWRDQIESKNIFFDFPPFVFEAFATPQISVRRGIQRLIHSRFVDPDRTPLPGPGILGYLYDIDNQRISGLNYHLVVAGEDWREIATRYKITLMQLQQANGLNLDENNGYGNPGQVIYIPASSS